MPRVVTITDNKISKKGEKKAVAATAPKIDKRSLLQVEEWIKSGKWVRVKSSNVRAIQWDGDNRQLNVEFLDGKKYWYSVSVVKAKEMFGCSSMGKMVWQFRRKGVVFGGPF